jgi:hypothetical protein
MATRSLSRKKIAEQLLIERLGLEQDWLDPDTIRKDFPTRLPKRLTNKLTPADVRDLEKRLDQLVAHGCQRGVLYLCLRELEARTQWLRKGGKEIPPLEDDPKGVVRQAPPRKLPTREDMATLAKQLEATRRFFDLCEPGLLHSAEDRNDIPLPHGTFTDGPSDPIDLGYQFRAFLKYYGQLAEGWATPYETTLMKSKEILHLLVYVSMCANDSVISVGPTEDVTTAKVLGRDSKTLTRTDAETIANIAYLYCRMDFPPRELIAKLKAFKSNHADLYARMTSKLSQLDRVARSQPL